MMNFHRHKENPFTVTAKGIKYLGVNLTKEVKDLYLENYKTQTKEIEDNTKMKRYTMLMGQNH